MLKANVLKIFLIYLVVFLGYVATRYFTLLGLVILLITIYIIRPKERFKGRFDGTVDESFVFYKKLVHTFALAVVVFYACDELIYFITTHSEIVDEILEGIKKYIIK